MFELLKNKVFLQYRYQLYLLFIFIIVTTIIEALSIGSIFPFLLALIDENSSIILTLKNKFFDKINFLNRYTNIQIIFLFLVFFIFTIKNIILIYFKSWKLKLISKLQFLIEKTIYKNYLFDDYNNIIALNSGTKIKNIKIETSSFGKYLFALIDLIFEILVLFSLTILLLFTAGSIFFISLMLTSLFLFFYFKFSKEKIFLLSSARLKSASKVMDIISESLNKIYNLKTFKIEKYFLDKYEINEKNSLGLGIRIQFLKDIQRNIIELSFIIFLCIFAFFFFIGEKYTSEAISLAGLIMLAFARMYPSALKISFSINEIKNLLPSLNLISNILFNLNNNDKNKFLNEPLKKNNNLIIQNLKIKIGNNKNFKVKKLILSNKDRLFIKGKSGSGKTTFLNIIAGLQRPKSGKVLFNNEEMYSNFYKLRDKISFISQNSLILNDTIKNNILGGSKELVNKFHFKKIIKICNIDKILKQRGYNLNTKVYGKNINLSGGEVQRISIARALYKNGQIIILDEFSNQLDGQNEKQIILNIMKYFKDQIIIIASHNLNLMKYCNIFYDLDKFKLTKKIKY